MSLENKSVDFKEKIIESATTMAEKAYRLMEEKKIQYDTAMKKYSVFKQAKENAYKNWQKLKNTSDAKSAYAKYEKACSSSWNAEVDSDILRDSYRDTIFYSAKMATPAIISNSILSG